MATPTVPVVVPTPYVRRASLANPTSKGEGLDAQRETKFSPISTDGKVLAPANAAKEPATTLQSIEEPATVQQLTSQAQQHTQVPAGSHQTEIDTGIDHRNTSSKGQTETAPSRQSQPTTVVSTTKPGTSIGGSDVASPKPTEAKRPALKTLHITSEMIAKSEAQVPLSAATERSTPFSTAAHARHISRQASVSASRPSTPAVSERYTSRDVSRAGSPPLSVTGSVPIGNKTKAQAKKERKKKAGDLSETSSLVAAPSPPAQPDMAPIVARQKKQKKAKTNLSAPGRSKAEQDDSHASPSTEDQMIGEEQDLLESATTPVALPAQPMVPVESTQQLDAPVTSSSTSAHEASYRTRTSYTLRDFLNDAAQISHSQMDEASRRAHTKQLLLDSMPPIRQVLNDLVENQNISKDHPLLNPTPFSNPAYKLAPDHRKGQAYLDGNGYTSSDAFGMVYLPSKEKRALYNGHAVSVADSGERVDDVLKRCLITPSGLVLRHLDREESEKVLDLEERRASYSEIYGELGYMDQLGRLEDDDYCNLEGGFEELSRHGEAHGICWILGDDKARRRYAAGHEDEKGLDDDYGLGDMPIDPDSDDQFVDADDEDDEEELNGEQIILGADPDYNDDPYVGEDLEDHYTFTRPSTTNASLPPLPDPLNPYSAYLEAHAGTNEQHSMYSSLNTPLNLPFRSRSSVLGHQQPAFPLPTQLMQTSESTRSTMQSTQGRESIFTLRAMDMDQVERTIKQRGRDVEATRKEAEKVEKQLNKKLKEATKTRDAFLRSNITNF